MLLAFLFNASHFLWSVLCNFTAVEVKLYVKTMLNKMWQRGTRCVSVVKNMHVTWNDSRRWNGAHKFASLLFCLMINDIYLFQQLLLSLATKLFLLFLCIYIQYLRQYLSRLSDSDVLVMGLSFLNANSQFPANWVETFSSHHHHPPTNPHLPFCVPPKKYI